MTQGNSNQLISKRLVRVPWWRAALNRLSGRNNARHEQTLQRLAQRDVSDTVGEEDVQAWLSMLDGEGGPTPAKPAARRASDPRPFDKLE